MHVNLSERSTLKSDNLGTSTAYQCASAANDDFKGISREMALANTTRIHLKLEDGRLRVIGEER